MRAAGGYPGFRFEPTATSRPVRRDTPIVQSPGAIWIGSYVISLPVLLGMRHRAAATRPMASPVHGRQMNVTANRTSLKTVRYGMADRLSRQGSWTRGGFVDSIQGQGHGRGGTEACPWEAGVWEECKVDQEVCSAQLKRGVQIP